MPVVERKTDDEIDEGTAEAAREIQAALSATAVADPAATTAETPEQPAAAASRAVVGHGTIRLRSTPRPSAGQATTTANPGPAAAAGPVGHGTIRLRRRTAEPGAEPRPARS